MSAPVSAPTPASPTAAAAIASARSFSHYLDRMLNSRAWLAETLAAHLDRALGVDDLRNFIATRQPDDDTLPAVLRELRAWTLCHVLVRDLEYQATLGEVTETMTLLAEVTIQAAHDHARAALVERHGEPLSPTGWKQELIIIGMGKLGGRELNVSSDIDLIFIYPEDGDTGGHKAISNFEFFERLGKRIIKLLNDLTEHGQVFRVDMRLRPHGDSGPLVCSFGALENYFITQGREWERYAWIKARALTGARFSELNRISRPFVFRKYLDFGAFNAMRDLHAQIRREVMRRDRLQNVKLGPGGIREIEFIAQVFQLIRGGRERSLQRRPTLEVLELLAGFNILAPAAVAELNAAYDFLRRVEHRLQYRDDAQTHELPADADALARLAASMGFASSTDFMTALDAHRQRVSGHFNAVFADPSDADHKLDAAWSGEDDDKVSALLRELGYADADELARRLHTARDSTRYQQLPAHIRARLDALVPRFIEDAARTPMPSDTLLRSLDLLEAISRRGAYLALLQQYPQARARVVDIVGISAAAAQYLTRHPILLDELLDDRSLQQEPDWNAFHRELDAALDVVEPDMEDQMNLMRERHHAETFRLLVQDVTGKLSVERLADHLSLLADHTLSLTLPRVWSKMKNRHRDTPCVAVIAYGKLGGKELGYASDLDLVYLFDDPAPEALEVYSRFVQRINTWLSGQTSAGRLYEADVRLRPNGDSGLLVSSLEAFHDYQLKHAWVWEHQALTRARFAAGDAALGARFERIREEVLRQPRDLDALRGEVAGMRKKMAASHASKYDNGTFELKHDPGGLVDVEFLVQYLVLGHAVEHAILTHNLGNIALLHICGGLGLIPAGLAADCANSYRELRRLQHRQRLDDQPSRVQATEVTTIRAPTLELWRGVFGADEG